MLMLVPALAQDAPRGEVVDGIFRFYDTVTIRAVARYNANYVADAQALWLYQWAKEKMNIEFIVEGIPNESADDITNLLFASGDLPEVFLNWGPLGNLTNMSTYGDAESQLLAIQDYITPEMTPELYRISQEVPDVIDMCRTAKGNIYTFPRILQRKEYTTGMSVEPLWYDPGVLAAVGYETAPTTVDELLDCLRKIKAEDPMGVGANLVPFGGTYDNSNVGTQMLNAFGFAATGPWELLAMRNGGYLTGDLVFMSADPAYYEYLRFMNTLYSEGLIDPDYYTMDKTQSDAKLSSGYNAMIPAWDCSMMPQNWQEWRVMEPLTSDYSADKQLAYAGAGGVCYYAFITDACKDVEAIMRFMDVGYNPEYSHLFYNGPEKGAEDTYGLLSGWMLNGIAYEYEDVTSGRFTSQSAYVNNVGPFSPSGNKFDRRTDGSEVALYDPTTISGLQATEVIGKLCPYLVARYPGVLFDSDTSIRVSDLSTVLEDYIEVETAKFITGVRAVTEEEFEKFLQTLDSLGLGEFMDLHLAAFEAQYRD